LYTRVLAEIARGFETRLRVTDEIFWGLVRNPCSPKSSRFQSRIADILATEIHRSEIRKAAFSIVAKWRRQFTGFRLRKRSRQRWKRRHGNISGFGKTFHFISLCWKRFSVRQWRNLDRYGRNGNELRRRSRLIC